VPDGGGNPVWSGALITESGIIGYDENEQPIYGAIYEPEPPEGPDTANNDADIFPNWYEDYIGTDKYNPDTDGDGISDSDEVTVTNTNPLSADSDGNGWSDLVDFLYSSDPNGDYDGDSLANGSEVNSSYNPTLADTDGDGWTDNEEYTGVAADSADFDNDGLTNYEELNQYFTNARVADTDSDGLSDGMEVVPLSMNQERCSYTDPNNTDTDSDGVVDYDDYWHPILHPDADGDGLEDATETSLGTDPADTDSDDDGLSDGVEVNTYATNPIHADTDNDSLADGDEALTYGTNPLLADTHVADSFANDAVYISWLNEDDTDEDGLTNSFEVLTAHTRPDIADTDGDTLADGYEINSSYTNPLAVDTNTIDTFANDAVFASYLNENDPDEDGLPSSLEIHSTQTRPDVADTDGDTLSDGYEYNTSHTNPKATDTITNDTFPNDAVYASYLNTDDPDEDGLGSLHELQGTYTRPDIGDTDGDTLLDGYEVNSSFTDPLLVDSLPNDPFANDAAYASYLNENDADSDGLHNLYELQVSHTRPDLTDTDGDTLGDGYEINTSLTDPLLADTNPNDAFADDAVYTSFLNQNDPDGDSLASIYEVQTSHTRPDVADSDNDGLNDGYELVTSETNPLDSDSDNDALNDGQEVALGTNPNLSDTDGDAVSDGQEVVAGTNPLLPQDIDQDGLADHLEVSTYKTTVGDADTDDDGLSDGYEVAVTLTSPKRSDTDNDTLSDAAEIALLPTATDPNDRDCDNDGLLDGWESMIYSTDPWNPDTDNDDLSDGEEIILRWTGFPTISPINSHSLSLTYEDSFMVDVIDSDGGGIPDRIEELYGMDLTNATDDVEGDLDSDGLPNIAAYQGGWSLTGNYMHVYDGDGDGMTNVWEIANGLNPNDQYDGVGDPDSDGLFNCEEAYVSTNPLSSDSNGDGTDDWTHVMQCSYPEGVAVGDIITDWDNDGVVNFDEVYINRSNPRHAEEVVESGGGEYGDDGAEPKTNPRTLLPVPACDNPNCTCSASGNPCGCSNCNCGDPTSWEGTYGFKIVPTMRIITTPRLKVDEVPMNHDAYVPALPDPTTAMGLKDILSDILAEIAGGVVDQANEGNPAGAVNYTEFTKVVPVHYQCVKTTIHPVKKRLAKRIRKGDIYYSIYITFERYEYEWASEDP
jgi:hypothetical protein